MDMEFMQQLTGFTKEKLSADLEGVIFRDLGEQPTERYPRPFITWISCPLSPPMNIFPGTCGASCALPKP
nr:hypothetical protein [uncultured Caproiciproducens sp.]